MPYPSKKDVFTRLKGCDVKVNTVIDVGVRESTRPLMDAFPKARHYLFEPMPHLISEIERNYAAIPHVLYGATALSDKAGPCFVAGRSIRQNGVVSHGDVRDKPVTPDGKNVIYCQEIRKCRLDDLELELSAATLLKIDVDGHELPVVHGAIETLKRVDIVVIEAPVHHLPVRLAALVKSGFVLFDIVDLCYYKDTLWQCDLVLVSKGAIEKYPKLTPFHRGPFSPKDYVSL